MSKCCTDTPIFRPRIHLGNWARRRSWRTTERQEKNDEQATTFLGSYYGAGMISRARAETWLACGSPQSVIDKIAAYIEAGCTIPVLRFVAPDPRQQLQRCIEEVLPAFKV